MDKTINRMFKEFKDKGHTQKTLKVQFSYYSKILAAIESFLMSNLDKKETGISEKDVSELAEATLAFSMADEEQKALIKKLFDLLAQNISKSTDLPHRKAYGKTLYGVNEAKELDNWVQSNIENLLSVKKVDDFLEVNLEVNNEDNSEINNEDNVVEDEEK
jgi:hypothetical protein